MSFSLPDHWVWDFWIADDGETFHLFYLHAPKSLGDPNLRHRNASIGRATSHDLVSWVDHGTVITPGNQGDDDATAAWTGSVICGPDGTWRMFYTGSRFLRPDHNTNIETVLLATSEDLATWTPHPAAAIRADPRWYEILEDGTWHEQAWRDPWVFPDPADGSWHMLVTARSNTGADERDRGIIGHAVSDDLHNWSVMAPLSLPGAGFAHLEVLQYVQVEGRDVLLFSCDTPHLAGAHSAAGDRGGVWAIEGSPLPGPLSVADATLVIGEELYAGRAIKSREGSWVLLGFENTGVGGVFVGQLSDPLPLSWSRDGRLIALAEKRGA